jgi:hypothetical protein
MEVGAYMCITVILNGVALNLTVIIRELLGLHPINAFLAYVPPSSNPTPHMCVSSSPDQMKSPFGVSPFSVQRTSEIQMMSYLKHFISFLSSSSYPAAHSVCTFQVSTVRMFFY